MLLEYIFFVVVLLTSLCNNLFFSTLLLFCFFKDNAFIIFGAYTRTDYQKDVIVQIEETMLDIGATITLTTVTSATGRENRNDYDH